MKKMKSVRIIMLLMAICMTFTVLPLTGLAADTDITADFTDANFLDTVREKIGKTNGEPIYDSDVNTITELDVNFKDIASLDGIQHFTALETLYCSYNKLTALNLSGLSKLETLECGSNQLPTLDLSEFSQLETLECSYNQLTALDLSGLSKLENLSCYENQLTTLNLSGLSQLQDLYCSYNQLTTLNLSGLDQLKLLGCSDNYLSSLDPTGLSKLEELNCYNNQITTLNLSGLAQLMFLDCGNNNIRSLDPSGLSKLETLYCYNNQITALNLSGLSKLQVLDCYSNCLTSLTELPASLKYFYCGQNRLTSLDVTELTLSNLYCDYNWMTAPTDVTGFTGTWGTSGYFFSPQHTTHFKAVTNIIGVPKAIPVNATIPLPTTAIPDDAEHKTITWTIDADDGTGAVLNGNLLTTSNPGKVWINAMVIDGFASGFNYDYTFSIEVRPSHTITASTGQGGSISPAGETVVISGNNQTFTVTANPKYEIADVRVDGASVGAVGSYSFQNITAVHTIEARFKIINPFTDVTSTEWFYDEVLDVYVQDLMVGTAPDKFSPTHPMTRAMAVTVLYRSSGETATADNIFRDVPADTWYEDAVAWGAANNIVFGVGNQKFDPMANVTREQLATFLYRYTQYKGKSVTSTDTKFNTFKDKDKASEYAVPTLKWACENDLLRGYGDGTLSPQSFITRAENAALLQRFMAMH